MSYTGSMNSVDIRPIKPEDQAWITAIYTERWGSQLVVSRGKLHDVSKLPGFVAGYAGKNVGLATYRIHSKECELVTLDSWQENLGVGTALIEAIKQVATKARCTRLWLITTNDNLHALSFYQKRGFHLVAVHPNALAESRKLKPSIPEIGFDGIPLRDELELQMILY